MRKSHGNTFNFVACERATNSNSSRYICTDVGVYPLVSAQEWQSMYGTHICRSRHCRLGMPLFDAMCCAVNIGIVGYYAQPQNSNVEISPFWENLVSCKQTASACYGSQRSWLLSQYLLPTGNLKYNHSPVSSYCLPGLSDAWVNEFPFGSWKGARAYDTWSLQDEQAAWRILQPSLCVSSCLIPRHIPCKLSYLDSAMEPTGLPSRPATSRKTGTQTSVRASFSVCLISSKNNVLEQCCATARSPSTK